jgi:hypothetical protein
MTKGFTRLRGAPTPGSPRLSLVSANLQGREEEQDPDRRSLKAMLPLHPSITPTPYFQDSFLAFRVFRKTGQVLALGGCEGKEVPQNLEWPQPRPGP